MRKGTKKPTIRARQGGGNPEGELVHRLEGKKALKAATEALEASERRYRELVDLAPIGIFRSTREGRFVSVNPALAGILGYDSPDEMLELDLRTDVYLDPNERDWRLAERGRGTGLSGFEVRWKRRDGSPVWVRVDSRVIRGESGAIDLFEGFVHDIQKRKDAEEALRGSEERYRHLFEKNPEAMWVFDENTLAFLAVNDTAIRTYGYSAEEFLSMTIKEIRPAEDVARLLETVPATTAGYTDLRDVRHRKKDGGLIDVEIAVQPLEFSGRRARLVLAKNVTERKRAEESVNKLQLAVEQAENVIFMTDPDGVITYVNPAFEKVYRLPQEEALGNTPRILKSGLYGQSFYEEFWQKLLAGQSVRGEIVNRRRDGQLVTMEESVSPFLNAEGRRIGFIAVQVDITERKKAEQGLRENDERYRSLFYAATDAIVTADGDGNIVSWNPSAERMFGYAAAEVTGQPATVMMPHRYQDRHLAGMGRLKSGGEPHILGNTVELVGLRRDGSEFPLELSLDSWEVASGRFFTANIRDISERKRAEQALRESERQFRAIFDGANDGMIILDDEGRYVEVNGAAGRVYGRPPGELVGARIGSFSDLDFEALWPRFLAMGRARGESKVSRPDGTSREIEFVATANLLPGRHLAILHDITERKRAEEALSRNEHHFRSLIENAQDVITIIDLEGTIRFQSPAAERILGRPPEGFVGRSAFDFLHPDDAPGVQAAIRRIVERPELPETSLFRFRHANGSWRTLEGIGKLLPGDGSSQIVVNSRDVTESRALEEQLRQSQKMEAVGRLAGGIAHDFNNLLTVITGYTELATGRLKPEDPSSAELSEIQRAAQRAADLTRQLLAFSRKQVLRPRVIDLNRVVGDTHKMLRRLIGEDIELVTSLKSRLASVNADPGQIEQALLNLAVNARDAMPKGGKLTIETSEVELDETYSAFHFEVPPGNYVLIAVSDTGTGMDAKTLSHVFEPFFTTKGVGRGTGLGLSMVYGIVRQSGGHVAAYSERGVGTTFKIYLPSVGEPPEDAHVSSRQERPAGGTETVLVVEDEEGVRRLACRSLEAHGYKTLRAAGGAEALLLCEKHAGDIHLMLTDVVMPHMGGGELAQRVAAFRPRMKVLFMSGFTDDAIVHHGVLPADTPFLQKPFTPLSLAQKVREVLDAGEESSSRAR